MSNKIHDLNIDKHVATEKLRTFLENQKLACPTYVYLKETEACFKEIEELKQDHRKYLEHLIETTTLLNVEANLAEQKERKQQENNSIWIKKLNHIVKHFQLFVSYCLNKVPDHAEFFINMEKLMLLQVNGAFENLSAKSIIGVDVEQFHTPVPRPKPFYLFSGTGYKPKLDEDLCPKTSGVSRSSDIPVMVINKRCLYAACDNFEQFTNKLKEFIHGGHRGDDADFKDDLVYEHFIPVKHTDSQQLAEIKLQSSLLQILEQEMAHVQTVEEIPIKCKGCELPWCSCHSEKDSMSNIKTEPPAGHKSPHCSSTSDDNFKKTLNTAEKSIEQEVPLIPSQIKNNSAGPSVNINRLEHEKEPKLKKYVRYIEPRTCVCAKSSKKYLDEHLPTYMTNMSMFDAVELPNYETCSDATLKELVKQAKSERTPTPIVAVSSKTKDICTQCSDKQFDLLCSCFSNSNPDSFEPVRNNDQFILGNVSPSYMKTTLSSFAIDRAHSRQIVEDAPELKEIFNKKI